MEKEILEVLKSIDSKITHIMQKICISEEKCECEKSVEDDEEAQIMNFLKGLTEELGLKDKVVIRKITLK